MFIFFAQNKNAYGRIFKKAQLAPLFIALITIIIIAAMITVNLNKIAITKTHTANAVDAGAIAAASQMAFAFNLLATQAMGMYATYQASTTASNLLLDYADEDLDLTVSLVASGNALITIAGALACVPWAGKYIGPALLKAGIILLSIGQYFFAMVGADMTAAEDTIEGLYEGQLATYLGSDLEYPSDDTEDGSNETDDDKDDADNIEDDESDDIGMRESMDENIKSARDMAYDYNFLNSGITEKLNPDLDKDGELAEDAAGNKINPSQGVEFSYHVSDKDTPQEFKWKDGQKRDHLVNVDVKLDDVVRYQFIRTKANKDEIDGYFKDFWITYTAISVAFAVADAYLLSLFATASSTPDCGWWFYIYPVGCTGPLACVGWTAAVIMAIAEFIAIFGGYALLSSLVDDIREGISEGGTFWDDDGDIGNNFIVTLNDVDHSREIETTTFQEHAGQDMGLWEAKYPKVKSQSCASFACNPDDPDCSGTCSTCSCLNGKNPCVNHDPVLVGVDEF